MKAVRSLPQLQQPLQAAAADAAAATLCAAVKIPAAGSSASGAHLYLLLPKVGEAVLEQLGEPHVQQGRVVGEGCSAPLRAAYVRQSVCSQVRQGLMAQHCSMQMAALQTCNKRDTSQQSLSLHAPVSAPGCWPRPKAAP